MNIDDLREQLAQLAGPEPRPTAGARDAVRGRVRRYRRRVNLTGAVASVAVVALVVAIVGVGLRDSNNPEIVLRTSPSTAAPAREAQCRAGVNTVPTDQVPSDVKSWAGGKAVVGHGELWTVRSAFSVEATQGIDSLILKFPWLTRPFGIPKLSGRRLDGAGSVQADANRAVDQNGVWVASTFDFSGSGCWELTARFGREVITFRVLVGNPPRPLAIGTIEGTLHTVGGPAPGLGSAIAGRFTIVSPAPGGKGGFCTIAGSLSTCIPAITGATNADGTFRIDVPVGRYTVSGTSPQYQSGSVRCDAPEPIVVTRGRTTTAGIECQMR